jgi:transcriptional regulator with XRE-family HTH domain
MAIDDASPARPPRRRGRTWRPQRVTEHETGLGSRLRAARISRGMTQETLGHLIGVSFQQVQKYEQGANRIAASTLLQIAEALKIEPDFILRGPGTGTPSDDAMGLHEHLVLVESFGRLPGPVREAFLGFMLALQGEDADRRRPRQESRVASGPGFPDWSPQEERLFTSALPGVLERPPAAAGRQETQTQES